MRLGLCCLLPGLLVGCAAPCCDRTSCAAPAPPPQSAQAPCSSQMVRGRPCPLLDRTGDILGFPDRVLLLNRGVNNHKISTRTEELVSGYLADNNLPDVLVRVNQYAPLDEWRRLVTNRRISAGWRYTIGAVEVLFYTLIPGRLIGDDWYNPFTNSIHLYSDVPAIALHEAAYAKNVHQRRWPGTYAALQYFPLLGMWYRTNATMDVLNYIAQHDGTPEECRAAEAILFPMYGGALGGQIGSFVPIPFVDVGLTIAGTAVGHGISGVRRLWIPPKEPEHAAEAHQGNNEIVPASAASPDASSRMPP